MTLYSTWYDLGLKQKFMLVFEGLNMIMLVAMALEYYITLPVFLDNIFSHS